jgi:hypothetical protein
MNPQKAHSLGVRSSDVRITTKQPNDRWGNWWEVWTPNEDRPNGKQVLTETTLHSACRWLAQLCALEAAQPVHLPELLANQFGCSRSEARRVLAQGGIFLDDVPLGVEHMDVLPVVLLRGRKLRMGKRREVTL